MAFVVCFSSIYNGFSQNKAQNDNFQLSENILLIIEEYLESAEDDSAVDVLELYEQLEDIYNHKLDINRLSSNDLSQLRLLSDVQINNFMVYKNNYGPFISIYEIQSIPLFDIETINRIRPFITLEKEGLEYAFNIKNAMNGADHELLLRSQRNLETLAGSIEDNGFLGDPYRYFLRYRLSNGKNFKFGILAEKDIGEEFFAGSNKVGFDFYSYYLSIRDINKSIRHIVLGDYTVSMGQGLILHNQFGGGLSSFTTNIKRTNGAFRQYTSRNEVNYFKGAGVGLEINRNITADIFVSRNKIDGTLRDQDDDGIFDSFSSIDMSGNHRSDREVSKQDQITRSSFGGILQFERNSTRISINVLSDNFDKPFERTVRLDNIFFPREKKYTNVSVDYSHIWHGVNLFGESAFSGNGGWAHLFGMLLSVDPRLDFSLIYRNYAPDYVSITPNSFGQGSNSQNEKGVYVGLEFRPGRNLIINAYADHWRNPWLKFLVDSPGNGSDYLLKVTYFKKRKYNGYLLFKTESKPKNSRLEAPIDFITPERVSKLRLHFGNKVSKSLELRNRIEISRFKNDNENFKGLMIYQDVLFRSINSPLSFTSRVMWFNIEDFDARIYTYENDVLNDFFVPFYSGKGLRYYLNLRYKVNRKMTTELRWAQTRYRDREVISSGLTEIQGNVITGVKAQVRFRF